MALATRATGRDDFFMFGVVYDTSPAAMSVYLYRRRLPATLDPLIQSAAVISCRVIGAAVCRRHPSRRHSMPMT